MRTGITVAIAALIFTLPSLSDPAKGSPVASVMQVIGESEIAIHYSRPGVKGRTIWGELVPYDEIWRAGANDKTSFDFPVDVTIGGKVLPKGSYSFYVIPAENKWTLIFNTDWMGHGTDHDADADVLRFEVTPEEVPHEEWLRYGFEDLEDNAANAYLVWEKKKVKFRIELAGA